MPVTISAQDCGRGSEGLVAALLGSTPPESLRRSVERGQGCGGGSDHSRLRFDPHQDSIDLPQCRALKNRNAVAVAVRRRPTVQKASCECEDSAKSRRSCWLQLASGRLWREGQAPCSNPCRLCSHRARREPLIGCEHPPADARPMKPGRQILRPESH